MYTNTIPSIQPICTQTFTHTHTYTYLQERNRMNFKENVWMPCIKKLTLFGLIILLLYKSRDPNFLCWKKTIVKKAIDVNLVLLYQQEDSKASP